MLRIDVCKGSEGIDRTVGSISFEHVIIGRFTDHGVMGQGLSQRVMKKGEKVERRNNFCLNRERRKRRATKARKHLLIDQQAEQHETRGVVRLGHLFL